LGAQIRAQRKALRLSATVTAEAAGLSRVTLHRIEKGEPSVTAGAWANALAVLGLSLAALDAEDASATNIGGIPDTDLSQWIPVRVRLADYPQLRALAWQVHGTDTLTPVEALGIYERNARHLDTAAMSVAEQALLQALRTGLGGGASVGTSDV
jgi:transcriptional regulator with XRE-family HTH domain